MAPDPKEVKHARKRKMKEPLETTPRMPEPPSSWPMSLPFNMTPYPPSTALRLNINSQYDPIALRENDGTLLSAPRNFHSFTTLLTAENSTDSLSTTMKENTNQIERAIANHGYQLKRTLEDLQERHCESLLVAFEERSAKKLNDKQMEYFEMASKNIDLDDKLARTTRELQQWKNNAKQIEAKWSSLQSRWQNFMTRGCMLDGAGCSEPVRQEEDQNSSHVDVDPNRVEPVKMTCRVCGNTVTTMMLWHCHHLCVCKNCNKNTKICPICQRTKTGSFEVHLE